ncbi:epithelial-stromal interaction protein 1 [Megalops cyprinoides]|uniref:epithelial-stromal interaction protein 1 n=1 Tax=Megalops cyprinoides TaxID=118141 RepID=UPI00186491FF|nr:epithelial-stromal interaction protein 1 [Megalops cyprinoides]
MDPYRESNEMNKSETFTNRRMNPGANSLSANETYQDDKNANPHATANTQGAQNDRQAQYAGGYTMIPPNESRRSKLQRMAQKEEQELQKWKEEHRPGPVNLAPAQLGGSISLAEARQKQFVHLRQSKLQKKLKQEEMDRKRREAEEEENQRMKAMQREKASRLEEKRRQEEQQRREAHSQHHREATQQFLQRIEKSSSAPMATSGSQTSSSWDRGREYRESRRVEENAHLQQRKEEQRRKSELLEEKQKELEEQRQRELLMEHRRINSAWLDRLEGGVGSGGQTGPAHAHVEDDGDREAREPNGPIMSPGPGLAEVHSDSAGEDEGDHEWAVMKLMNAFPFFERDFLEDIVAQCNGNYQQAYSLLQ